MAVSTNREKQAPFQPLLSGQSVATHVDKGSVQEGVVDTSTGALISAVGEQGLAAYEGYQVADTERKIKQDIEAFTGVTTDPEEDKMNAKLGRLVNGRNSGGMTELEFRVRVENAVKAGISTMPGRASVFRKAAAEILGDNDAAIDFTVARQKAATQANDKLLAMMQAHFKVSTDVLQGPDAAKYQRDFAELGAAEHALAKYTAMENLHKLDRQATVREVSLGASAHAIVQGHKVRQAIDTLIANNINASQLQAEGKSREAILEILLKDQTERRDFAEKMTTQLKQAKGELINYYQTQAVARGVPFGSFKEEMKAQEETYDTFIAMLSQPNLDADALSSFVKSYGTRNQGVVDATLGQSTLLMLSKGALSEAMQMYFSGNQEYARATLGDEAFSVIDNLVRRGSGPQLAAGLNKVAAGTASATGIAGVDPTLAKAVNTMSIQNVLDAVKNGFPTKTKLGMDIDTEERKESFVNNSISILETIKIDDKESIRTLKKVFGTKYADRLAELPDRLQSRVTNVLKEKYDTVLGTKNHPTSVLGRLFTAEARHAKVRDAQPESAYAVGREPNLWVEIKNGKLVHSDTSLKAQEGKRIVAGNTLSGRFDFMRSADVTDHIAAVADANLFLEARYEAATLLGDDRTWPKYLDDFYREAYLGTKPGFEDERSEKIEEGANAAGAAGDASAAAKAKGYAIVNTQEEFDKVETGKPFFDASTGVVRKK